MYYGRLVAIGGVVFQGIDYRVSYIAVSGDGYRLQEAIGARAAVSYCVNISGYIYDAWLITISRIKFQGIDGRVGDIPREGTAADGVSGYRDAGGHAIECFIQLIC